MADPQFPIVVPEDQVQEMGVIDAEPVFQTHRGPKPGYVRFTENEPPYIQPDQTFVRPS